MVQRMDKFLMSHPKQALELKHAEVVVADALRNMRDEHQRWVTTGLLV